MSEWILSLILFSSWSVALESPSKWEPPNVTLTCGADACPSGLGALFFPVVRDGQIEIVECAGTVVASRQVVTDVHCLDEVEPSAGWFFPLSGSPTKVDRVLLKVRAVSGSAIHGVDGDVAVLSLTTDVAAPPARVATFRDPVPQSLTGYILKLDNKDLPSFAFHSRVLRLKSQSGEYRTYHFTFSPQICRPGDFPLPLSSRPANYYAPDCQGQPGNSGSAYFDTQDPSRLEGLLISRDQDRKGLVLNNLRCLRSSASGFEFSGCVPLTTELIHKRQTEVEGPRLASAMNKQLLFDRAGLRWEIRLLTIDRLHSLGFFWPVCSLPEHRPGSWRLPSADVSFAMAGDDSPVPVLKPTASWTLNTSYLADGRAVFQADFPVSAGAQAYAGKPFLLPRCP